MRLTRRRFLGGAAAAALGGAGIYELVDQLTARAARGPCRRAAADCRREQHVFDLGSVAERGHRGASCRRCTARSSPRRSTSTTCAPRSTASSSALRSSTRATRSTRPGLGVTVAWGLPYFDRHVPQQAKRASPVRPPRRQAGAAADAPLPERSARHDPRGERRRRPAAQRQPRAHRRRAQGALRRPAALHRRRASAAASRAAASRASRACRRRWRWRPASPAPI